MTSQPPTGPGPSWRATPPPPAPQPAPAGWRAPGGPPAPATTRRARLMRLGGALAAVLGTAGLLVWLLLWLAPPGPAVLVLAGAGYEDNLAVAHNAPGREAMARLARLAGTSAPMSRLFGRSGQLRLAGPPIELRRATDWAKGLDGAREQTAVVFLALHGGADRHGAYLVPHDSDGDEGDRVRIAAVLDRLAELPAGKKKLLILDATGQVANWSQGLLINEFARALNELEPRIAAVPNLVVLSASDVDQRSARTADGRVSLFAHHLVAGLAGAADGDRDGRLDAWELYTHVRDRVQADAGAAGEVQVPVLLPRAGGEDRARALSLTFRLERPEDAPEPAPALPDVQAAWASYHAFPAKDAALACAPGDWQLWGAWLVRYEQLLLAGSPLAGAARLKASEAEARVRAGLNPGLASAYLTLAMPALIGEPGLALPRPYPPLERLWRKSPAARQAAWDEMLRASPGQTARLRRDLQQAALDQAAASPGRDLQEAAQLTRFLDDPVRPTRPAEPHFLVMLEAGLATKPPPEALAAQAGQALSLRVEAERAALAVRPTGHAYAERVFPWTRDAIARADEKRQLGQDLLFSTSPADWQRAGELLDAARLLYAQARADAAAVGAACAARDRALYELPLHARWLAATSDDPPADLMAAAAGLFEKARRLEALLAEVPARRDAQRLGQLGDLAREAQAALTALEGRLDAVARNCESTGPASARDAAAVLEVPGLAPARRWALVQMLDRLARRRSGVGGTVVAAESSAQSERVRRQGARQGQLALASVGRALFDRLPGAGPAETFAEAEYRVRNAGVDEQWWALLRKAGDQIGARLRRLPDEVGRLAGEAKRLRDTTGLARADALARRLDAGQAQADRAGAPGLHRRAGLQGLLVWQAERTWRDHWHGDDPRPGTTPYFRIVGLDLLSDARRVDPVGRDQAPGEAAARQLLEGADTFDLARPRPLHLVAGERRSVSCALGTADQALPGFPVVWAELGDRLAFGRAGDEGRRVVRVGPGAEAAALALTVSSPDLEKAEQAPPAQATPWGSAVTWKAYHRGALRSQQAPITLHPAAPLTQRVTARPPAAGVAVRASSQLIGRLGEATGALAVVLDCSGSMGPPKGQPPEKGTYRQLTAALRAALARVPRGTSVSVWVFGQAVPPGLGVAKAEDAIERVFGPVSWKGTGDVDAALEKVEGLTPWNESPIARTMLRARADLTNAEGFRGMLVLSDGMDNRIAADKDGNPEKLPIADLLRGAFRGSNIQVHFMGLPTDDRAEVDARAAFEAFARQTGGTATTTRAPRAALEALDRLMQPRLGYRLAGADGPAPPYRDVAGDGASDRWQELSLAEPTSFRLDLRGGRGPRVPVVLGPGDGMLLRLVRDGDRAGAERVLYSLDDGFRRRPARQAGDWRAALLQNQNSGPSLQMLLTLERGPGGESNALRLPRPREVWVELAAKGPADAAPAVTWGELAGYPAAAYGIDVPAWPQAGPQGAAPALRVWWLPTLDAPGLSLKYGTDFRSLGDLAGKALDVRGETVTLDSAGVERRWVQAGGGKAEPRWCLVVRATHAAGRPVRARAEGLEGVAGEEHRFYPDAGRYVGLFWFRNLDTREQVEGRVRQGLAALAVTSVTAVKKEAGEQSHVADFTDLDAPDTTPRPRPPLGRD